MKKNKSLFLILSLILCSMSFGNDTNKWFLNPNGQIVQIDIDDVHSESVRASSTMNWGFNSMKNLKPDRQVKIAIIDGGVDIDHEDIKNFVYKKESECLDNGGIPPEFKFNKATKSFVGDCVGWDFVNSDNRAEDEDGHGTHVSGIVTTILRDFPNHFKIVPLRAFSSDDKNHHGGSVLAKRLEGAFSYAIEEKVQIIHISAGWPKSLMSHSLSKLIEKALNQDIMIVAASGNSSSESSAYPCQINGVVCVGSLRPDKKLSHFSNTGNGVDLLAPGSNIFSAIPNIIAPLYYPKKGYDYKNGTSQAAPFVTGVAAALFAHYPQETSKDIFSRLMLGAEDFNGLESMKGLLRLDQSLNIKNHDDFVYPLVKNIEHVSIENNSFGFDFSLLSKKPIQKETTIFQCDSSSLNYELKQNVVSINGTINGTKDRLSCVLKVQSNTYQLSFKLAYSLKSPMQKIELKQEKRIVFKTRTGTINRLLTVPTLKGARREPIYFLRNRDKTDIYGLDGKKGVINFAKECQMLKIWQVDLNKDGVNDLLVEKKCGKKYLEYLFLNSSDASDMYPSVRFVPDLAIMDYNHFSIIRNGSNSPKIRFINTGTRPASTNPWDNEGDSGVRGKFLYELAPVFKDGIWKYETKVIENKEKWKNGLGLRYLTAYDPLHLVGDKLLISVQEKTAWINLDTHEASWANLDSLFWGYDQAHQVINENRTIFQSLITPFEYRGYILGQQRLRFVQKNKKDPIMDILATRKTLGGYQTFLRSFLKIWILDYNQAGALVSQRSVAVDRFDFLNSTEMLATISSSFDGVDLVYILDGTRISSNRIDIIKNGMKKTFKIPAECSSQLPVVYNSENVLPLFCSKTEKSFEIRLIEL